MRWFAHLTPSEAQRALLARVIDKGDQGALVELLRSSLAFLYHPLVVRHLLIVRDAIDGETIVWPRQMAEMTSSLQEDAAEAVETVRAITRLLSSRGGKGSRPEPELRWLRTEFLICRDYARRARALYETEARKAGRRPGFEPDADLMERILDALDLKKEDTEKEGAGDALDAIRGAERSEMEATYGLLAFSYGYSMRTVRRWIEDMPGRPTDEEFDQWRLQCGRVQPYEVTVGEGADGPSTESSPR
jgi:hypothetical protein